MRCAGTESFLSGLFGARETHSEDPHVRVKRYNYKSNYNSKHVNKSINIINCSVRAGQFNNREVITVHFVNDVPTQL